MEIEATEKTLVQPGDTIKVEMTRSPADTSKNLDVSAPGGPVQGVPLIDAAKIRAPNSAAIEHIMDGALVPW